MIPRCLHQLYAFWLGYFWLPCPLCGKYFGGHEWKDRKGRSSRIVDPARSRPGATYRTGICPNCTRDGLGDPASWKLR